MEKCREVVKKFIPSARLSLCLMVFWGQIQNYMMRSTLSLLIVAMVNQEPGNSTANNYTEMTCLADKMENEIDTSSTTNHGEALEWEPSQIGQVLGAFNMGYICTQAGITVKLSYKNKRFFVCRFWAAEWPSTSGSRRCTAGVSS